MKLSELDRERFNRQKEEIDDKGYFTLEDGTKSCEQIDKKFKYPKGTKMPPRIQTAYNIYRQENLEKNMAKQALNKHEASSVCLQVWEKLTDKQKQKFENLSQDDTSRYNKQICSLQQNGYFLNEDGTKSTD